jgi:hypothetical protein
MNADLEVLRREIQELRQRNLILEARSKGLHAELDAERHKTAMKRKPPVGLMGFYPVPPVPTQGAMSDADYLAACRRLYWFHLEREVRFPCSLSLFP